MELSGVELLPVSVDQVIAMDVASESQVAALLEALRLGQLQDAECTDGAGFCSIDVHQLGAILDTYVVGFEQQSADAVRRTLAAERDARLCIVQEFFPNAPALPEFECPDEPDTDPDPEGASFTGENAAAVAIPDNDPAGVESTIAAAGSPGLKIQTVQVFLDIEHSWRGDLSITLTPPGGQPAEVISFDSNDSADDVSGRFDVTGLGAGGVGDGVWTLRVEDRAGSDTGTLGRWSLGVNAPAP
jgi:hypothetical protein